MLYIVLIVIIWYTWWKKYWGWVLIVLGILFQALNFAVIVFIRCDELGYVDKLIAELRINPDTKDEIFGENYYPIRVTNKPNKQGNKGNSWVRCSWLAMKTTWITSVEWYNALAYYDFKYYDRCNVRTPCIQYFLLLVLIWIIHIVMFDYVIVVCWNMQAFSKVPSSLPPPLSIIWVRLASMKFYFALIVRPS